MDKDLELLHQKLDYLTEQLEAQRQQQEGMNELMHDAVPVVNHMIKLSIDELAEIGTFPAQACVAGYSDVGRFTGSGRSRG